MKFSDLILGLLIFFVGGAISLYVLLKMGITFPTIISDFEKFFGVKL